MHTISVILLMPPKKEIQELDFDRENGYLYYAKGDPMDVYKKRMKRPGQRKSEAVLVAETNQSRGAGQLYYIKGTTLMSVPMARGGSRGPRRRRRSKAGSRRKSSRTARRSTRSPARRTSRSKAVYGPKPRPRSYRSPARRRFGPRRPPGLRRTSRQTKTKALKQLLDMKFNSF
jgi:hypothetical protein